MTRPDPLDVLERIHRDAALLRELTGDALTITIEPAKAKVADAPPVEAPAPPAEAPRPRRQPSGLRADDAVREYLRGHGASRQVDVAQGTGLRPYQALDALRRLQKAGQARDTGRQERAPGVNVGRGSPVWEPVDPDPEPAPDPEPEPPPDPEPVPPPAAPTPPALSRRTQKSIERAHDEAKAIAALGDPPQSRVLDLVRDRALNISQLAAELGTSRVLIAEEIHHLKPWLIQLHDGRVRALEHLRREAA